MVGRRVTRAVLVAGLVLSFARPALANGMSPIAGIWPGFVLFSPLLGIPATLLAAFLERPFVTLGGLPRHALVESIRANLLSWAVGAAIVFVVSAVDPSMVLLAVYFFGSVPLSIGIEGVYLRSVAARQGGAVAWGWIIAGNLVSGAVLIFAGLIAEDIGTSNRLLAWRLREYQGPLTLVLGLLSLAIVVCALWPRRLLVPPMEPPGATPAEDDQKLEQEVQVPALR